MTGGLVCVAGIDLASGAMVRPLKTDGTNWEEEKWVNGGYMVVGNVLNLEPGNTPHRSFPHAHEDFFVLTVGVAGEATNTELFSACNATASVSVASVLDPHIMAKKYVNAGSECRSLFCVVQPKHSIKLSDKFEKIQLSFPCYDGWYNLPVTDLAARSAGDPTAGVENLRGRIDGASSHIAVRLGLAREWDGPNHDYDPKRCYLQVNGVIGN
ncbi:dual OB domain-containing protein [Parablastomonas sp. CN1-191]|uniref:dual OB domain-containing protein n=1 Tax=Parablastomonas sp. CN1-191 TaxID=3400908 RepID=UPI003BF8A959